MDSKVPEKIISGFSYEFSLDLPKYPSSDGWSIFLAILLPGVEVQKIQAVYDGSVYVFTIAPNVSGALPGGLAAWQCSAEISNTKRELVDSGRMEIIPDLTAEGTDPRSKAELMINAIDALLQDRATDGQAEIMYNGRQLKFMPVADLLRLRSYYLDVIPDRKEPDCELIRFGNPAGTPRRPELIIYGVWPC